MDQLNEKIAYLAGLAEGLDIDTSTKEGKLLKAIVEAMGEISDEIVGLQSDVADLEELVDEIDEDLGSVEEDVYKRQVICKQFRKRNRFIPGVDGPVVVGYRKGQNLSLIHISCPR